jgi:hypothetical protein
VAFRLLSFPIPPMPLCATQGEDHRDGTASSTDLITCAMQVEFLSPVARTLDEVQNIMREKEQTLSKMTIDIARLWTEHDLKLSKQTEVEVVHACYVVFQQAFREYMKHFPSSPDLRFMPMSDVAKGTNVHRQTIQFIENTAACVADDCNVLSDVCTQLLPQLSYADLLRKYIVELKYIVSMTEE